VNASAAGRRPSTELQATLVRTVDELASFTPEWRSLAERLGNAFVSPEWFLAWHRHYGQVDTPYVVAVRDATGALRGVMPLVMRGHGPFRTLRFAGGALGDRFEPAALPEEREQVAAATAALLGKGREWAAVILDWVEDGAPWLDAFTATAGKGLARTTIRTSPLPYLDLSGLTWESYLASRSGNFRSQLGRRRRRLERDHDLAFHRVTDGTEVHERVDTLFRLHESRWSGRGSSSLVAARRQAFLTDFAALAFDAGWLRLLFLDVDGTPVAGWYGWRVGERFAYYQAGLDPAFAAHSAGFVLLGRTLEEAFAEGAREYDFLRGDEEYKSRFTGTARQASTWLVAPKLHPVRAVASALLAARAAARRSPKPVREALERLSKRDGHSA
jgi:CelD/BcsL family acetyltransferase involved in cellulose biosynthesis